MRLVNRTARTISLTEAGTRYAEFASRIIDEIDREDAQLKRLRDKAEGPLAIISPKWIGSNDVGDAIVAFSAHYPKIHIRFEVGSMSERSYEFLDRAVRARRADADPGPELFLDFVSDWFRRQARSQTAAQARPDAEVGSKSA